MRIYAAWLLILSVLASGLQGADPASPDFNREVRPILSKYCFKCHGPDNAARRANMRLDLREEAVKPLQSGHVPIVPGNPEESALAARIYETNRVRLMPPAATKTALTEAQKEILKRWIANGADYPTHWAFVKPRLSPEPKAIRTDWPRNTIDRFILARLESEGLQPSRQADPHTLARRLYLDLIGLPPTVEEAEEFVKDPSDSAYEALVDRLLASPHYGERWARKWLDLARYADTNGYEKDRQRSIWPWRDWVIRVLNADVPFDQFTIEQIAGDMLPNATQEQIVATGFHRNTMLNEEGGVDPLEFRYLSVVDRLATTGKTWLGMTIQCAQCHTHKYDPIPHREYYGMMAYLNNADEPEIKVLPPDNKSRRAALASKIARLESELANQFPLDEVDWHSPGAEALAAESGQRPDRLQDGSWLFTAASPPVDTYTVAMDTDLEGVDFLRLEALPDNKLPKRGPGRSESANFVLTELTLSAAPKENAQAVRRIEFKDATADFSQDKFPVKGAIDGDPKTGWAIANYGMKSDTPRTAIFSLKEPLSTVGGARLLLRLEQNYGGGHTLGRFRFSLGVRRHDERPLAVRRREVLQNKYNTWLLAETTNAVAWTRLRPVAATANMPFLAVLPDDSVLASGDQTKSDTYRLKFHAVQTNITAIRLEALPDDSLPRRGPGRTYYEGSPGDFNLSDFRLLRDGKKAAIQKASHSYAAGGFPASNAIDDNMQTGWAIDGGQGRVHTAVFSLAEPLSDGGEFEIQMLFERHFCADLGRFRISVAAAPRPVIASGLPPEIENILLVADADRTPDQRDMLFKQYLSTAPELAKARAEIESLRQEIQASPTTLVMRERPPENPRPTFVHKRGDFLQPSEPVEPAVLSMLNFQPDRPPRNRLEFARWLVSPEHPLTARVTVNRQWAAFFGRGIVRTVDDFGYQGEPPSHPELLDWLAVHFMQDGWSLKNLHKLIVMSAAYRQASAVPPELLARDPANVLLARGPRLRLEAEAIRDSLLRSSGLLSTHIGGPGVFPPQPASVTTEGAYGPLAWKVSEGPDRYRRGLYTFSKRTAPYAMFNTFDGPAGEVCLAQREVSDTPLQALTLLNDTVVLEAAQALGRFMAAQDGSIDARLENMFRRCLTRPPAPEEKQMLANFYDTQKKRFEKGELDALAVAGKAGDRVNEQAAWTVLARALFNLDEAINKL